MRASEANIYTKHTPPSYGTTKRPAATVVGASPCPRTSECNVKEPLGSGRQRYDSFDSWVGVIVDGQAVVRKSGRGEETYKAVWVVVGWRQARVALLIQRYSLSKVGI